MKLNINCILCGGSLFEHMPYYYLFNGKIINIVQCRLCSLSTIYPMPSASEITSLYVSEYFDKDFRCGISKGSYIDEVKNIQLEFSRYLTFIKKYCPEGNYLEIGCAGGAALVEARKAGYVTIGVEFSPEIADWGKNKFNLDIRKGTLEDQQFPENFFDVIFLGDVIEHIPNPNGLLTEMRRILKHGGIAAFAFPMELNHFTPRIRHIFELKLQSPHKPFHLFYYNIKTLNFMLEKHGFITIFTKADKLIQHKKGLIFILDLLNLAFTRVTGLCGDRGFIIAQCLKA